MSTDTTTTGSNKKRKDRDADLEKQPLDCAAHGDFEQARRDLIQTHRVDICYVSYVGSLGLSPLCLAIRSRNMALVELLLRFDANTTATLFYGRTHTALFVASGMRCGLMVMEMAVVWRLCASCSITMTESMISTLLTLTACVYDASLRGLF
jgi:hypothetical protein